MKQSRPVKLFLESLLEYDSVVLSCKRITLLRFTGAGHLLQVSIEFFAVVELIAIDYFLAIQHNIPKYFFPMNVCYWIW